MRIKNDLLIHIIPGESDNDKIVFTENYKLAIVLNKNLDKYISFLETEKFVRSQESIEYNKKRLKKLIILLTNECNLRCRYCYLDYGNYQHTEYFEKINLNSIKKVVDQIYLDFVSGIDFIQFFGGEPLIAFDIIQKCIIYINNRCESTGLEKPKYGMVTNGLLLDEEKQNFFKQYNVLVTISIDGNTQVHDKVRKTVTGKGSYEIVKRQIEKSKMNYYSKAFYELTINREHIKAYKQGEARKWLNDIRQIGFSAGVTGYVEFSKDKSLDLCTSDYKTFKQIIKEIVDYFFEIIIADESFYHIEIMRIMNMLLHKIQKPYSCGAGVIQLTLSPDGKIYPCPKFVSFGNEFEIGSDKSDKINYDKMEELLIEDYKKDCMECWAHMICGIYCSALKFRNKDNRESVNIRCWYMQEMLENIIRNYVILQKSNNTIQLKQAIKKFNELMK